MTILRHITAMVMAAVLLSCSESDALDDEANQQQQRDPVDYSTFTASIDTNVTSQKITRAVSYASSDKPNLTICFDDDKRASYTYDSFLTQYVVDEGQTMGDNALYVYSDKNASGAMVASVWSTLFEYDATTTIKLKNMNPMVRISYKYNNAEPITEIQSISLKNVYSESELSMKGTQLINRVVASDTPTGIVEATVTTTLDNEDILSESELAEEAAALEASLEDDSVEVPLYTTGTYELYTVPQTLCGYQGYVEVVVDGETLPYYFSREVTLQSGYLYDLVVEIKSVDNALTLDVDLYEYEEWNDNGDGLAFDVDLNNSVLDVWDGSAVSTELEGHGYDSDPYLIKSAADLKLVADLIAADVKAGTKTDYLASSYKLMKNIDWDNNSFSALGSTSAQFIGYFDGGGCSIKNVMLSNDSNYSGFFAVVGDGTTDAYKGQVKNLTISNVTVTATSGQECGVLVGLVKESGLIENCHILNSSVTAGGAAGGVSGGLLGAILGCVVENTTITALNTTVTTNAERAYAGGIVGLIWSVATVDITYSLALSCTINGVDSYTGGIVGSPWNGWVAGMISNSYASNIISENTALYGVSGLYAPNASVYSLSKHNYHDVASAVDTTYCLDSESNTLQQKANLLNGNAIDTETVLADTPMWYWGVDNQRNTPYPYYYVPNSQE